VDADLDTLLIALYVELEDRIIPAQRRPGRRGPGRPPVLTDAELVCLAVAQVLLRYHDERRWLRAAPARVGHLFPRLLGRSEYNARLKQAAPLLEAALRWIAAGTPGSGELLRLMDGTPIGCGSSKTTSRRSNLFGYAGYGYESSHSRWYWGVKLMLICTPEGTITGFSLANPKLSGERSQTRQMLTAVPANRPPAGTAVVCDRGLSGSALDDLFTDLDLLLIRPAYKKEHRRWRHPGWLRQRVEAIIWTLKNQLGLEQHNARVPAGLWTRTLQRLLALNTVIWHNWTIGAPIKRSLTAYDH
jgi:Transposase DDE domain